MTLRRSTRFRPRLELLEDRRLLNAGMLDPTFNPAGHPPGTVTTDVKTNGVSNDDIAGSGTGTGNILTLQFGALPVIAGVSTNPNTGVVSVSVARYLPNGILDPFFGTGGIANTGSTDNFLFGEITGVAAQPDGKLVVAGDFADATSFAQEYFLERLDVFGHLDPTFGTGGQVILPSANLINTSGVVLQANGKIDVATTVSNSSTGNFDLAVTRFLPNGSLDTSYGSGGVASADLGSLNSATVSGIALTPGGRAVVAGTTAGGLIALAQFNHNGTLDTSFGGGTGKETLPVQGTGGNSAGALTVGADGKILVVGTAEYPTTNFDFLLARLNANGTLDTTFGSGGFVHTDFVDPTLHTSNSDVATGVAFDQYGRIVVSGTSEQNVNNGAISIALARYNPANGALDTSFGSGGKVLTTFTGRPVGAPVSLGIELDDKIVVGATTDDTSP